MGKRRGGARGDDALKVMVTHPKNNNASFIPLPLNDC